MSAIASGFNASQLYAMAHQRSCEGELSCHWCGAPCTNLHKHDDPLPQPYNKTKTTAKNAQGQWVCTGCSLWRRPLTTIFFLDGKSWQDRQAAMNWGWLIREDIALAIRPGDDGKAVYDQLLHPSPNAKTGGVQAWALSFVTSGYQNHIHLQEVNATSSGHTASTGLVFTLNNIKHTFSVHELEQATRTGVNGKEPGVRILFDLLGPIPSGMVEPPKVVKDKGGAPEEMGQALRKRV